MRTRNYITLSLLAFISSGFLSCNDENHYPDGGINQPASVHIRLIGSNTGSRAVGTPSQEEENVIANFTAFVFNSSGTLEGKATVGAGQTTGTISGLTAGNNKKVVVVANVPSTLDLTGVTSYSWFADTGNMFNLDTQSPANLATNGLAMSGETSVNLVAGANNIQLAISRVVAKIQLGTVDVDVDDGHDGEFILTNVHLMKVRGDASLGLPTVQTGTALYGGTLGTVSQTTKSYLTETVSFLDHANRYFYVFPNDNTDGNATLLTLEGTYEGNQKFYAIRINGQGNEYIERNTAHIINVTIKRPGNGTTDPELVPDPATLEVTIVPQNWVVVPPQNVEW